MSKEYTRQVKLLLKDLCTKPSLANPMLIDHDAIKALDAVHKFIDRFRLEQRLSGIHNKIHGEKA